MQRSLMAAVVAAGFIQFSAGVALAADPVAGQKAFAVCKACHQVGEKAKNGVGPILNGVVGRPAGSVEGFKYSDAMKSSGITWDEAALDEYLKNPKAKVPGNKMAYAGLKDDTKRADVIAYLSQIGADGKLPQ
ncbi:MAG TPA: cytochrome c family protein [Dongiaceae bacterium]|nr:cytochrome c family protein [Dongiaceae bacterium]